MALFQELAQFGVGIFALGVLVYVVRELRQMTRDQLSEVREMQKEQREFFGNHMSHTVAAIEKLADAVKQLHDEAQIQHARADWHHRNEAP